MELNGIIIPKEFISTMTCGNKLISFDFDEHEELARELSKIEYSCHIERKLQNRKEEEFWIGRVNGTGVSLDTLKRIKDLTPQYKPRYPVNPDDRIVVVNVKETAEKFYIWESNLGHEFEAIQEKLLFGCIFDESTQELVFFERPPKLSPLERAIVLEWLPNVVPGIRKYTGTGLKFFIGLDEYQVDYNQAECRYNANNYICEAKIRPLLFDKEWRFRYMGETTFTLFLVDSPAKCPNYI